MKTLADFTALVKLCIETAEAKYGKMDHIDIRYDLRGRAAGMAGGARRCCLTGKVTGLYLRFNREAIAKDWDMMVQQTIPHEVAHIVAYSFPQLGADHHNWKWAEIDRSLGGTGARCHSLKLTPARQVSRYTYVTNRGREVSIGPKHHKALQTRAGTVLTYRKTGETVTKDGFQRAA